MKKTLFYMLPALILAGCAQDFDLAETTATGPPQTEATSEPLTRSVNGAIYNEVTGNWMISQPDPFALANVQAAYDKLAAGLSAQSLSKSEAAEFPVGKKLAPTHYALKIYPKSEEEQSRVETMKDVNVAYIPFSYSQLSQEEVAKVEQSGRTRSTANTFAEKSPYTVTYENYETTDGGPTGPVTYQLPILYTVWPVEKPLPTNLEYVVDYPVFLPELPVMELKDGKAVPVEDSDALQKASTSRRDNTLSPSAASLLFGQILPHPEGRSLTRGKFNVPTLTFLWNITAHVNAYDGTQGVQKTVPLANLKVTSHYGSYFDYTQTDKDGYFSPKVVIVSSPDGASGTADFTFTYEGNRWKVLQGGYTAPCTASYPFRFFTDSTPSPVAVYCPPFTLSGSARQENEIHLAANYFYNVQNVFPKHYAPGGTTIFAHNSYYAANIFTNGSYTPSTRAINIYNTGQPNTGVMGTTLHEIGHLIQHHVHTNLFNSHDEDFIIESFAPYAGWYLGEAYYAALGWQHPGGSSDITGQARQSWTEYSSSYYSPLFVDLTDSYNQYSANANSPNDGITAVPPTLVWNIIATSASWPQCRTKLLSYAGTGSGKYYTNAQFNAWIVAFDNWASINYY